MRREQYGDAVGDDDAVEQGHDLLDTLRVEVRERLVEQQQLWAADERMGDEDALLLAARQGADPRVRE